MVIRWGMSERQGSMIDRKILAALSKARASHQDCLVIAPHRVQRKFRAGGDNRCDLCKLADRILEQELNRPPARLA
jgi:hypothetical protein